ncbi:conserved hypothetical protein [Candidatus Nitrotoga sp. M5]|nr:conserved hypothetical protein [Candidatus Nitrotoga sp. M5]
MPIANCLITQECSQGSGNLIELWANESGISSKHMTINIVSSSEQLGNKYKIMANLSLPSMWSTSDISSLQIGLAKALSQYFAFAINEVHVITNIVTSGMVVESGQEIKW